MPESRALGDGISVYNALDSTNGTTQALSANMGRVLNERLMTLEQNAGSGSGSCTCTPATDADIDALFE